MDGEVLRRALRRGLAIVAHPLALNRERKLDERRQRALTRYYVAAGAGGVAVAVHTTQFAIRKAGLLRPVLALAREELDRADERRRRAGDDPLARIGGICGKTRQATREAALLAHLNFHAGLLSLGALKDADEDALIEHCKAVAESIPLFGFYLQPAAGGRPLSYRFWRRFFEIEDVYAVKIAPFDRYRTLDVVRAVADAGRDDIALYTGNDDSIVHDLVTPLFGRKIAGGLLGHWAVWARAGVDLFEWCRSLDGSHTPVPTELLRRAGEVTDMNAAVFDAANNFAGCLPGIHEVLRRQGLLEGVWCLEESLGLSPGQAEEIERVAREHAHLTDDDFVAAHRDEWLSG